MKNKVIKICFIYVVMMLLINSISLATEDVNKEFVPSKKIYVNELNFKDENDCFKLSEEIMLKYFEQFTHENVPKEYKLENEIFITSHGDFIDSSWKFGDDIYSQMGYILCIDNNESIWLNDENKKLEGNLKYPNEYSFEEKYWKFVYNKDDNSYNIVYNESVPIGYDEFKQNVKTQTNFDLDNIDTSRLLSNDNEKNQTDNKNISNDEKINTDKLVIWIRIISIIGLISIGIVIFKLYRRK